MITCCASIGAAALRFTDKLAATGEKLLVVCASNVRSASALVSSTIVMLSAWARRAARRLAGPSGVEDVVILRSSPKC